MSATWAHIGRAREASNTTGPWQQMLVNLDRYDRAVVDPVDDNHTLLLGPAPAAVLCLDSPLDEMVRAMGLTPIAVPVAS